MRFKSKYLLSIAIVLFVAIWIFSGMIFPKKTKVSVNNYNLASVKPEVQTEKVKLEHKSIAINLYAIVDPLHTVIVKSEAGGKVIELLAKEGGNIKKDDIILIIENEKQRQELEKSRAILKQRTIEYNAEQELVQKGYSSKVKLATSFSNLKDAESFVTNSEVSLENTIIKSPMDGTIDKIPFVVGDMINISNTVIAQVHAPNHYVARTFISEKKISDVEMGAPASITLVNDRVFSGNVSFISSIANPDSKTYRVDISFISEEPIPLGMTAKVDLSLKVMEAYYVKSKAIFLNDLGLIGVKILDAKNIVNFIPVEILSEESSGFWIKTKKFTPPELLIITLGGNFVKNGDKVVT